MSLIGHHEPDVRVCNSRRAHGAGKGEHPVICGVSDQARVHSIVSAMKGPSGSAVGGPSAADRFYFPQLDGLRAVAFLGVFGFHFAASSRAPMAPLLAAMAEAGSFGVDLFFILSSFLITSLLFRERAAVGRIHVAAFWVRRALRIWPLYFVFVGIFIA